MTDQERSPPHSIEAEQALLGAVLMNNEAYDGVQWLEADDFAEEFHRHIWQVIAELIAEGRAATPISIKSFIGFETIGEGDNAISVKTYIARLAAEATTVINAPDYAHILRRMRHRRQIVLVGEDLVEFGHVGAVDARPGDAASAAIEALDGVVLQATNKQHRSMIGAAAKRAVERAQAVAEGRVAPGTMVGVQSVDQKLGGLKNGNLIVLSGRPGMGKTAVALSFSHNIAVPRSEDVAPKGVMFFSQEMGSEMLAQRLMSKILFETRRPDQSPVPYKNIINGRLGANDLERLWLAQRELESCPLLIDATPQISLSQVSARSRRTKAQMAAKGIEMGLIVVDHIGLMKPPLTYRNNRERDVAEIIGGLKGLAVDLDVPVMALAQLSRKIDERPIKERRPTLTDLRESGSIEQDADMVIGLFREVYYLEQSQNLSDEDSRRMSDIRNKLEFLILKGRNDGTGQLHLACYIASNVIADLPRNNQPEFFAEGQPEMSL